MSTTTVRIAECAEEIHREAVRILSLAPVLSPESLDASLRVIRLNVGMMAGLGKSLSESSCAQSGGHCHDAG